MKKYLLLVAIIFASCAEQKQEPKTAGYSIRGEEESYMIGSDETTTVSNCDANDTARTNLRSNFETVGWK